MGPFEVGKSSAVDVCQWQLFGSKESSKIDPGNMCQEVLLSKSFNILATKDSTLKRVASQKTFSCVIEDHTSSTKEKNLAKAAFDKATIYFQVIIPLPF